MPMLVIDAISVHIKRTQSTMPVCSTDLHAMQSITIITGITVALATAFPKALGALAPSGEGLATLLMQVGV